MAESLGDAILVLDADQSPLDRKLVAAETATQARLQATAARMQRVGDGMVATGGRLTRGLTLPAIAAGAAIGLTGAKFETEMQKIVGLVGVSQDQVNEWSDQLLELGPKVGKSPQELAEALFFVASAGFEGQAAIDVLTQSAKASSAGLGETKTIADAVTSAINAYGAENLSATEATDILTAAVKEGKLEASALAPQLGRLLPIASELGVGFDEVAGFLASMSRTGLDASTAASALQAIMGKGIKTSQQARDTLEQYGLSAEGIRESIDDKGLLGTLRMLRDTFGDNQEAMGLVFEDVQALSGVLNVLGQDSKTVDEIMQGTANAAGMTEAAFAAMAESAWFKGQQALSQFKASMIEMSNALGPILLPALAAATTAVAGVAGAFSGLPGPAQTAVLGVVAFVAATGPMIAIAGRVVQAMGLIVAATIRVRGVIQGLAFAIGSNPLGALIVGLGAAVAAFGLFTGSQEQAKVSAEETAAAIRSQTAALRELEGAERSARGERLAAKEAALAVKDAEARLRDLRNSGDATARQVKQAEIDLKQARIASKDATARANGAEEDRRATLQAGAQEAIKTHQIAQQRVQDLAAEVDELIVAREMGQKYGASQADLSKINTALAQKTTLYEAAVQSAARSNSEARQHFKKLGIDMKDLGVIAEGAGVSVGQKFPKGVRSGGQEARQAGRELGDKTANGLNSAEGQSEQAGSRHGSAFSGGVGSKSKAASGAGRKLGASAASGASTADGRPAGEAFGQGFADGIRSWTDVAAAAAAAVAQAASAAAKRNLKVRSPSRVMYGVGENFGEGFADGIDDSKPRAVRAVQRFMDAVGDEVEKGLARLSLATSKIGEELSILETLGGLAISPGGTELTEAERQAQVAMLRDLLAAQKAERSAAVRDIKRESKRLEALDKDRKKLAGKLAAMRERRKGMKAGDNRDDLDKKIAQAEKKLNRLDAKRDKAKAAISDLRDLVVELQGLTGKGGAIFETLTALADLNAIDWESLLATIKKGGKSLDKATHKKGQNALAAATAVPAARMAATGTGAQVGLRDFTFSPSIYIGNEKLDGQIDYRIDEHDRAESSLVAAR